MLSKYCVDCEYGRGWNSEFLRCHKSTKRDQITGKIIAPFCESVRLANGNCFVKKNRIKRFINMIIPNKYI